MSGALLAAACSPPPPAVSYAGGEFQATGWSGPEPEGGWASVFTVTASRDPSAPPMLGDYRREGSRLIFIPRFPPAPGVEMVVSFRPNPATEVAAAFTEPGQAVVPSAEVVSVDPSAPAWPANTLRMYVTFSKPMATGEAWTRLRVLDPDGKAIEKPFVELEPELWDPTGVRLTILFDPGRVKRGLVDNEASGPPLVAGRTVTLEVDPAWRDADGVPMKAGFRRTIQVGADVRETIDLRRWTVEAPGDATAPLVIRVPRPLDHALASRAIRVVKGRESVAGDITLEANDTALRFVPASPWSAGRYEIVVDGILEDVAGNRMGKLFDVDTADPTQSAVADKEGRIPFEVRLR